MNNVRVINASEGRVNRATAHQVNLIRVAAYCRVSTDSDEQLLSYNSQVIHYRDMVNSRADWQLVDIYADEGISGTQVFKRIEFQRMINDAVEGKIDLIITKSISRFARNTLDTLKYVRLLKEKNVAIQFEKENINTMTMNGEMLLVILSSLAQQETESLSANVKMGLKMKMKRGELIGFHGCLGYDYDTSSKTLTINEEESKIVKYIFDRYVDGVGSFVIARELRTLGYKTKKGNINWTENSVRRILKNEKYKGDVLLGKTFTVDPITHRRLENMGEEDKYYIDQNHEGIISNEQFEKVQEILNKRSLKHNGKGRNDKYSRKFAFSSVIKCAFCDTSAIRRTWHAKSDHEKHVWSCMKAVKYGKSNCPHSKGADEKEIEAAFVKAFNTLCKNNKNLISEFLKDIEETLVDLDVNKEVADVTKSIDKYESNLSKLIDMHLDNLIDKSSYENKYRDLVGKINELKSNRFDLEQSVNENNDIKKRMQSFKSIYENNEALSQFDKNIFESVIDEVILGNIDDDNNIDPYFLTFVFKTGLRLEGNAKEKKFEASLGEACSYTLHESCGVRSKNTKGKLIEILVFEHSARFFKFNMNQDTYRNKEQLKSMKVCIAIRI